MINYSIVKRSVNANLIEINPRAKSRINPGKREGGQDSAASDLALVKTESRTPSPSHSTPGDEHRQVRPTSQATASVYSQGRHRSHPLPHRRLYARAVA